MTDDDFELRLEALLNESVDRRAPGSVRVAPPFTPPAHDAGDGRRRARWVAPLAVAACIAAVVTGAVVLRNVAGPDRRSPVVDEPTSVPAPKPTTVTARLGGATIVLPAGWVARSVPGFGSPAASSQAEKLAWCLSPASLPVAKVTTACPLTFGTIDPRGTPPLDVDVQGGYEGNPSFCLQGHQLATESDIAQTRSFGGRSADWRSWDIRCTTGQRLQMEQYVVATDPGYVLESQVLTPSVHAAMTEIAGHSRLPVAASTVRLFDRGRITSLSVRPDSTRVTLQRVYEKYTGNRTSSVDLHRPAETYVVPARVWSQATSSGPLRRGAIIQLTTDGRVVTDLYSP